MAEMVQYGVAVDLYVPIPKAASTDFAVAADWTPAGGDVKVIIDGVDNGNIATLPTAVTGRAAWKIPLSAAEVTGRDILVVIVDSATKVIVDQAIRVRTFGHQSASDRRGIIRRATAQSGVATAITLDASASAADYFYNGCFIEIVTGTGTGQIRQIIDYNGTTKAATVNITGPVPAGAGWVTSPDATSVFQITGFAITPLIIAASNGIVDVNVTKIAGNSVIAAATVTFPASVASPTNITAGTITTATNLTNAPTVGDLTAVMKTSVTAAATAATPNAAAVTGAVGSVTANVNADVKKINAQTITGDGSVATPFKGNQA